MLSRAGRHAERRTHHGSPPAGGDRLRGWFLGWLGGSDAAAGAGCCQVLAAAGRLGAWSGCGGGTGGTLRCRLEMGAAAAGGGVMRHLFPL